MPRRGRGEGAEEPSEGSDDEADADDGQHDSYDDVGNVIQFDFCFLLEHDGRGIVQDDPHRYDHSAVYFAEDAVAGHRYTE